MTWYIQIHDADGNVLVQNWPVGTYKKYSKWVDKAAQRMVDLYPSAKRWEVRPQPYTHKVAI